MAPKKSKNAVVDRGVVVVKPGTPVMVNALAGTEFECPTCARRIRRGIVYRFNSAEYCSRSCFPSEAGQS